MYACPRKPINNCKRATKSALYLQNLSPTVRHRLKHFGNCWHHLGTCWHRSATFLHLFSPTDGPGRQPNEASEARSIITNPSWPLVVVLCCGFVVSEVDFHAVRFDCLCLFRPRNLHPTKHTFSKYSSH
jgi:hypothetical protein